LIGAGDDGGLIERVFQIHELAPRLGERAFGDLAAAGEEDHDSGRRERRGQEEEACERHAGAC
jgi:hypothetical protein